MAITIDQQPASQNYSYNELVYVLQSDQITQTEFSFVISIIDANAPSGTLPFVYRKQPNPTSRGIVNVSNIINDNLYWEINALGAATSNSVNQVKTFTITFSEEYYVDDVQTTGASVSTSITVIKGVREQNTGLLTGDYTIGPVLSNQPSVIRVFRTDNLVISTWTTADGTLTNQAVAVPSSGASGTVVAGGKTFTLDIYDTRSDLGEVRFWWFNRKGGIDCFTADQEATQSVGVEKRTADSSTITHGFTTSSNREPQNSNVFKAGEVNYGVDFSTTNTKNTRWLNQEEADLVAGLFESPKVYIQVGNDFIPTTIINSSYDALLTLREKDLFQYNIMYRYTNDKRSI